MQNDKKRSFRAKYKTLDRKHSRQFKAQLKGLIGGQR